MRRKLVSQTRWASCRACCPSFLYLIFSLYIYCFSDFSFYSFTLCCTLKTYSMIDSVLFINFLISFYSSLILFQPIFTFTSQSICGIIFVSGTVVQFFQQTFPSEVQLGLMIVKGTVYSSRVQLSHVIGIQFPTF